MSDEGDIAREPIFRDIRRYYCQYCGICRSKKALIAAHIREHHGDEFKGKDMNEEKVTEKKSNICEECGASFQKPAHLKQHMQSHSLEIEVRGVKHWIPYKRTPKCKRQQYDIDWISIRWGTA